MEQVAIINKNELQDTLQNREKSINLFLASIDNTEKTKEAYKKGITYFFNYLDNQNITTPTQIDIVNYKRYLIEHNEAPSINLYLSAIKRLYKFLHSHYGIDDITEEIKSVKQDKGHKKDGLNITQAKELLQAPQSKRDRAIIYLLLTAALREIELERANIEDLQTKGNRYILRVQGKGHETKDDHIIITNSTYKAINEYLATRKNIKPSDPLFISESNHNSNGRLTTRSIRRIVKSNLQDIGINTPKITTHSLRHTAITQCLLNNNFNIYEAQQLARHRSPSTTQIYIDELANEEAKTKSADILEKLYNN